MIKELSSVYNCDSIRLALGDEAFIESVKKAFEVLGKENYWLVKMGQQKLHHPYARGYREETLSHTGQPIFFISPKLGVELLRRIKAPSDETCALIAQAIEIAQKEAQAS